MKWKNIAKDGSLAGIWLFIIYNLIVHPNYSDFWVNAFMAFIVGSLATIVIYVLYEMARYYLTQMYKDLRFLSRETKRGLTNLYQEMKEGFRNRYYKEKEKE